MMSIRLRLTLALTLGTLILGNAPLRAEQPAPPTSAEIQQMILLLGSDDYAAREQATRDLVKIGPPACSALEPLAQSPDPELRARTFLILQQLYSDKDLSKIDAAQEVLERLRSDTVPSHIRLRAETILATFEKGLEERALKRLLDNGAVIFPAENSLSMINPGIPLQRREGPIEYSLFLGAKWKGDTRTLVLDLKRIRWLFLYYSAKAKIDLSLLQEFPKNNPRIKVEPRGEAQLGVTSMDPKTVPLQDPMQVPRIILTRVVPGSAAEEAGLKEGDEIVSFDGHAAHEFKEPFMAMIGLITQKNPGDKIKLQVKSADGSPERTVTPVLKGWITRLH